MYVPIGSVVGNLRDISSFCARIEGADRPTWRHQFKSGLLMVDWLMLLSALFPISKHLPYRWNFIESNNVWLGLLACGGMMIVATVALLPLIFIRKLWIIFGISSGILTFWFYIFGFFAMWGII